MSNWVNNVTNISLDWSDPYDQLDGQILIKSAIVLFQTVCLLTWTILGFGMASYEQYGEDPQKRGLGNQVNFIDPSPILKDNKNPLFVSDIDSIP